MAAQHSVLNLQLSDKYKNAPGKQPGHPGLQLPIRRQHSSSKRTEYGCDQLI